MQNIWNNILLVGPNKQNAVQRRNFGYEQPIVRNITAEKSFNNPNFVNKNHPRIHNYYRNNYSTPSATVVDSQNDAKSFSNDTVYKNSSQTILETLKENLFNAKQPVDNPGSDIPHSLNEIMCNKNARKNGHRSRKDQSHNKKHGRLNKEIEEMMDIDSEAQNHTNVDNVIVGLKEHHPLTFLDILCDNSVEKEDAYFSETDEEDVESDQAFIISSSPSTIGNKLNRERTISATESEDSFIVFENETDDELDFTDNSQEEDESDEDDESEVTDEVDSTASSVVPRKKVRFADDNVLCEIHPMIKWSYAYQKARIGPWQKYAVDRVRFKDHIRNFEEKIKPVLDTKHREQIYEERFKNSELPQG